VLPPALQGVRGVESWAGHRFDITTVRCHKCLKGCAGRLAEWTDISKMIGKEMRRQWGANRGEYA
jgi:hypothetical protein